VKKVIFTTLLISSICLAQDPKAVPLNKGEVAPFEGVLLNKDAAVSLKVEIDSLKDECNLKLNRQKDLNIANCDYEKTVLINSCEREKTDLSTRIGSLNQEIDLYKNKVLEEQKKSDTNFWTGTFIGAAGGVLVTSIVGLGIYIFR
jgi:hypothetical protein